MASIVFEKKLDDDIKNAAGNLEVMTYPKGMKYKVEVKLDPKIEKEANKDPLLNQQMMDAIKDVYDDLVTRIGENLKNTDKGAIKLRDTNQPDKLKKLVEVVNKGIIGAKEIAEDRAVKDANKVWEELAKKKTQYRNYKIKIVVTITAAVAGLTTSIALMAATPFSGGASAAFGIIGMVKSTATIAKEVASAWLSVEEASTMLDKQLKIVEAEWAKSKVAAHGNEVTAAILNQFLGVSQPCIKTCIGQLDTCKKKLTGIDLNCHTIAKDLNKMLKKNEELKKEFMAEAEKRLNKHPSPLAKDQIKTIATRLDEYLKPFEDKVTLTLGKLEEELKRTKTATETVGKLIPRVATLSKMRGMPYTVLDNVLIFTDVLLSPLNGNGAVSTGAEFAQNFVPAAASLAIDRISNKVLEGTFLA